MTSPIGLRLDDPSRAWESSNEEDLTCKEGPLASASHATTDKDAQAASSAAVRGPHAEAHAEDGDYYAEAFVLQGRDGETGIEVEVFSASIQQGWEDRAIQAAMARMGGSTDDGHFGASGEVFTAQARSGIHNSDGSTGFGASVGMVVAGGEITGTLGPVSLTAGASIGSTVGGSVGVRDGDHDGKPELCGRVEFGVGAVGLCVEKWW